MKSFNRNIAEAHGKFRAKHVIFAMQLKQRDFPRLRRRQGEANGDIHGMRRGRRNPDVFDEAGFRVRRSVAVAGRRADLREIFAGGLVVNFRAGADADLLRPPFRLYADAAGRVSPRALAFSQLKNDLLLAHALKHVRLRRRGRRRRFRGWRQVAFRWRAVLSGRRRRFFRRGVRRRRVPRHLAPERRQALAWKDEIAAFARDRLRLTFHPYKVELRPVREGIGFVGHRILPEALFIRGRCLRRFRKRLREPASLDEKVRRVLSYQAHIHLANDRARLARQFQEIAFREEAVISLL